MELHGCRIVKTDVEVTHRTSVLKNYSLSVIDHQGEEFHIDLEDFEHLKLSVARANTRFVLSNSSNALTIPELINDGDFELGRENPFQGLVLLEQGLAYGNLTLPKSTKVPETFCCLGSISYYY